VRGLTDHIVGLVASIYLATADSFVRGIIKSLLKRRGPLRDELVNVACDWGFRTAAAGLIVELGFAFRNPVTPWGKAGFLGSIVGAFLLVAAIRIDVGDIFERRLGPRSLLWRPTMGRILQIWLLSCAALLILESLNNHQQ
jgi:hypothetical protein